MNRWHDDFVVRFEASKNTGFIFGNGTDPGKAHEMASGGKSTGSGGGQGTAALLGSQKKTQKAQADVLGAAIGSLAGKPNVGGNDVQNAIDKASGRTTGSGGTNTPAGTAALLGAQAPAPGAPAPTDDEETAPAFKRTSTQPMVGDGPTYDKTGRLLTDGPISSVPNASMGQIVGSVFGALAPGGMGLLNGSADLTDPDEDTNGAPTGGYLGRMIDGVRGVQPGAAEGQVGNRVASNAQSRGDRPSDGSGLEDRASGAATAALTGDAPSSGAGTDALFSDVALQDRKKPKSDLAGTNMLLKAA